MSQRDERFCIDFDFTMPITSLSVFIGFLHSDHDVDEDTMALFFEVDMLLAWLKEFKDAMRGLVASYNELRTKSSEFTELDNANISYDIDVYSISNVDYNPSGMQQQTYNGNGNFAYSLDFVTPFERLINIRNLFRDVFDNDLLDVPESESCILSFFHWLCEFQKLIEPFLNLYNTMVDRVYDLGEAWDFSRLACMRILPTKDEYEGAFSKPLTVVPINNRQILAQDS